MTSIISLAISAWLQSRYNAHHNYPSISIRDRNTFTLFTSVWTIVFNLIFVALFLRASTRGSILASVASHFIIFFLTWIFWLAAAASLSISQTCRCPAERAGEQWLHTDEEIDFVLLSH